MEAAKLTEFSIDLDIIFSKFVMISTFGFLAIDSHSSDS